MGSFRAREHDRGRCRSNQDTSLDQRKAHTDWPEAWKLSGPALAGTLIAVLLAFLGATACEEHPAPMDLHFEFDDWTRQGEALRDELKLDVGAPDESYVTEPIAVGDTSFDRVALMFDAAKTPAVEIRVSFDGGHTFNDWVPATLTFQEDIAHNAHADVPHGGTHIQVRFADVKPDDLSYLFVDAFVFEPDPVVDPDALEDMDTIHQELAADAGVDVTRSGWNARSSRCSVTHSPHRMTIHHTVTPNNDSISMAARMRQMQNHHMDSRGFCDIGYHFCVGQDGRVYQGRPERYRGAHVGGANTGNAGISFIGTFTSVVPSNSMMDAGAKIIWAVADYYGIAINRERVKGHREYSATECPGNALYPKMNDLVARAQAHPGGGGGTTPTQGVLRGAIYQGDDLQDLSRRISGATVTLNNGASTTTDGEGWYAFDLEPGSYTITATATGFSSESATRDVTSGSTTWGSIRLHPQAEGDEGTARGVVFWIDDAEEYWDYVGDASRRLSGASVTFTPGDHSATTGSDGYYRLDLPTGQYSIRASADGYDDGVHPEGITVEAGQITWGSTPVLTPGEEQVVAAPRVTITDPPDGAVVTLQQIKVSGTVTHAAELASFTVAGEDTTVEDGSFEATVNLSAGENTIEAIAEDDLGGVGEDEILVIFEGDQGGLEGFVYDVTGGDEARVEGAVVELPDIDSAVTTDGSGFFSFDLDGGTYNLRVSAADFVTHRGAFTIFDGQRLNLRIGLEPGNDIVEQLVEIDFPVDGEILDRAEVIVRAAAADPDLSRATINGREASLGEEGSFTALIELEPGENVIEAVAFKANEREIGRASITVKYNGGGGCGCSTSRDNALLPALLLLSFIGVLSSRKRR